MTRFSYMFSDFPGFLLQTLISLPAILIALSVHELCHGLVAHWCGDETAKNMGRLSMNPFRHIDPIGFLMLLLLGFGFAKPVMINPRNLRKPRRDMAFVSAAGPLSNFLLGFLFTLLFVVYVVFWSPSLAASQGFLSTLDYILTVFLQNCCYINIGLFVFNLIPIPPLDGSKILYSCLPPRIVFKILPYEKYMQLLLFVFLLAGVFSKVLPLATTAIFSFFADSSWGILRLFGV